MATQRVWLAVDVTRTSDDARGPSVEVILDELEAHIEAYDLDVDGHTYTVRVVGIGATKPALAESVKNRAGYAKGTTS